MTRRTVGVVVAALSTTVGARQPAAVDEARAAWQYRREVVLPAGNDGRFAAVPLPPELAARSQPGLRDLRLIDAAGRETPFVVMEDTTRQTETRVAGRLVEAQQERRDLSSWTVDFGRAVTFDRIVLDVSESDFSKRLRLDVSADGVTWETTGLDHWVFDRRWQQQVVHHTTIEAPRSTARYARLTADDSRSRPIAITGATAASSARVPGSRWTQDVPLELLATDGGRSRYLVPVPPGFPVTRVSIDADDAAFARPVAVVEQRDGSRVLPPPAAPGPGPNDREAGRHLVYRFRLPDSSVDVESRDIEIAGLAGGALVVEVEDGDNPPLVNPRARLSAPQALLVTAAATPTLTLYYGNPVTRAAVYDLERLRHALTAVSEYPMATLGAESANPRYRAPAPLAFVPARGAAVDVADWRFSRVFRIGGTEDLYTLTVPAADVARMRRDLADLRVVDASHRQVPYVVEPATGTVRVPLAIASAEPRQSRTRASAYRLLAPAVEYPDPVTFTALELDVAEGFFTREVTVLVAEARAPLGQRVAATRTIASARRDPPPGPVVVSIGLGELTASALTLEIDNGDNAPLTLQAAHGVAPVPRVTFKAGAGEYRLLFGNDRVPPPSYDLAALRQEVLAYSALPVAPDALQPRAANPEYARGVTDVMRDAPPAAVLWGALGAAVLMLLMLTRRILKSGPPEQSS